MSTYESKVRFVNQRGVQSWVQEIAASLRACSSRIQGIWTASMSLRLPFVTNVRRQELTKF